MMRNKNVAYFLKNLEKRCDEKNVKLDLLDRFSVKHDGVYTGGSFGADSKEKMVLTCCTKRPDWLQLLVHESCHMDQYLYDEKIWYDKGNSYDQLDAWLHSKRVRNIDKHINNVQDLEADCERRSVKKIQNFSLPIDIKEYTQRANAYIYFFSYLKHSRRWPNADKAAYCNVAIWNNMPTEFQKSYRKLPLKYFKLFENHL